VLLAMWYEHPWEIIFLFLYNLVIHNPATLFLKGNIKIPTETHFFHFSKIF